MATMRWSQRRHGGFGVLCIGVALTLGTVHLLPRLRAAFVPGVPQQERSGTRPHLSSETARKQAVSEKVVPMVSEEQLSDEQLHALSLTFMQKMGKAVETYEELETATPGKVDVEEFGILLQKMELECTAQEARALFDIVDVEKNGLVGIDEMQKQLRESRTVTDMYNDSLRNVALTLVPTFAAALGFLYFRGGDAALDFVTGYVVEDSLSVDNLFVFLMLFKTFKVPPSLQPYCLNVGIIGAVVLRAVFIFAGLAAIKVFRPLLLVFSLFLLYSSYTALAVGDSDDEDDEDEIAAPVQKILQMLPTTPKFHGDKLAVQDESGRWLATPLALCIVAVELSDILFAVDSVPAVFAVTDDPLIVFTSNIAAILGLRSLYQLLAIAAQDLVYLEKAVALVLGFVGAKLAIEVFGYDVGSTFSLGVIVAILGLGIGLSLKEKEENRERVEALKLQGRA